MTERHTVEKSQCLPLYRYTATGERIDNITDWGLQQFQNHYTSLRGGTTNVIAREERPKQSENNEPSSPVCYANSDEVREEFKMEIASPDFNRDRNDEITKENIFHYVYAVLHHPAYRKKYELNLKREFPRIPFYDNFFQWSAWGKQLMDLHINYETVEPYDLKLVTSLQGGTNSSLRGGTTNASLRGGGTTTSLRGGGTTTKQSSDSNTNDAQIASPDIHRDRNDVHTPKTKLKALKDIGVIQLDENTELHDIPKQAWEYKLGNRSALEWILDQYKEKKPSDPTIAEKFNTYKFADYKEKVIELLKRVCTVSVQTMKVVGEMEKNIN